jgi:CBS domain-containing protein
VTCSPDETVAGASRTMMAHGVGSIIVVGPAGDPLGIVTDRDLRERVLAAARPADERVRAVMSAPLVAVSPEAFLLEGVLEMLRHGIHHLPVVEAGRLVGVISSHEVLLLQATGPLELARRIQDCASLPELAGTMPALADTTRGLLLQGVSGYQIGRVVAELNDLVAGRVLAIVGDRLRAEGHGSPPVPFCWFVLGSEGRREQALHTDQDNALVYETPPPGLRRATEAHFRRLAQAVIEALVELGYPRCPGGSMASNPRWCQPLDVWAAYFEEWVREPVPQHLLYSSIYFDLRPVAGETRLTGALRAAIHEQVRQWRSFPRHLARLAVSHAPPLNMLGRFRLERRDGRRGVDLKLSALLLLVNALRAYAIELGLAETNTIERLEAATRTGGCFTPGEAGDIREAYETVFLSRLRHQLARLDAGLEPDSFVDPRGLGQADQRRLRDAFRAIRRLQGKVELRYFTEAL